MNLLALDTSTERLSLAVQHGDQVFSHEGEAGAQASAHLIEAILQLLERASLTLSLLDAIAFGRGPGAFTGLRTACSVAQGLALGLNIPLLPIDTLLCLAQASPSEPARVLVCMDARMGQVYAAAYERTAEGWLTCVPSMLCQPDAIALPPDWHAFPMQVVGNAHAVHGELLTRSWPKAEVGAMQWPSARAMLELAKRDALRQAWVTPAQAHPLYVRDEVARTTAQRLADRKATA